MLSPFRFVIILGMIASAACSSGPTSPKAPITGPAEPQKQTPPVAPVAASLLAADSLTLRRYLLGQFDPASDDRFVKLSAPVAGGSAVGTYLRKEAFDAFVRMHADARAAGVNLTIISATRTFNRQKQIWEEKWTGKRLVEGKNLSQAMPDPAQRAEFIMRFSAMPGASRHHWGTDIDLNALENSYFRTGQGKKIYDWLSAHAREYGFCQVYSAFGPDREGGYQEEMWHWSYLPLASGFLAAYEQEIDPGDLTGFAGSETAGSLKVIERYVSGISTACK